MTMANTDNVARPASLAPSDMINADTTPPTNGGIATTMVSKPKINVPTPNRIAIIPKIPESAMRYGLPLILQFLKGKQCSHIRN